MITILDKSAILVCLQELPFFREWESAEVDHILDLHHLVHFQVYRMGEFFIHQEDLDTSLYVMLAGRASVVKSGSSIPLAELRAGQFFGEVSFLTEEPRGTNVIVHGSTSEDPNSLEGHICSALGIKLPSPLAADAAVVMRLDRGIMELLRPATREILLNHFIATIVQRLDAMNERITQLTGKIPMLSIDAGLSDLFDQASLLAACGEEIPGTSIAEREALHMRLLRQLFQCQKEMNDFLIQNESG
ncbi:MAG: cyclic nucleotide-binding domain-containing protein [Magnetococcus sp. DMHC-1]|nr:cyclic nucleotide-binding domain-containing protein [Magnetococcales bacterium]